MLAETILLHGDIMKIKDFLLVLLIQCAIFLVVLFSPHINDIAEKDFKISCMDKLVPRVFQLKLPPKKSIQNYSISFANAKGMGRTAVIEIWFDSELPFSTIEKIVFQNNATKKFFVLEKTATKVIYTDGYAKYKMIYINNNSYCIHISVDKH